MARHSNSASLAASASDSCEQLTACSCPVYSGRVRSARTELRSPRRLVERCSGARVARDAVPRRVRHSRVPIGWTTWLQCSCCPAPLRASHSFSHCKSTQRERHSGDTVCDCWPASRTRGASHTRLLSTLPKAFCILMGCAYPAAFCSALLSQCSRRLVAMEVTSDSKLRPAGALQFDSNIRGVCAFASSGEQLVATTHADSTVRLWRHLATATNSGESRWRSAAASFLRFCVNQIVCADTGLLVSSGGDGVQLCRVDGSRIGAPIAQPQLGDANIMCWCRVQDTVVAYDSKSESLLTLRIGSG